MASSAPGSTTCPSNSARGEPSQRRLLRVNWVFPRPAVTIVSNRHVIGRDDDCQTVLTGQEISRRHAELRVEGLLVAITDLGSRNGIYVNATRREAAPLVNGDVLRCGEWVGVVAEGEPGEFGEIAPGWFGGATLRSAVEPARRASADLPLVIQGETGTGKEGLARAVHSWSGRGGAFIAVNCATLPVHLAESELFGHKKGAFTGAERASPGLFRAAHRGTLFLDEIQELPASIQPKLLRVLEQHEVLPIGEVIPVPVDVRTVVATQESLAKAVMEGRFRADLQARLDGMTLILPSLRMRREDVVPLFLRLLGQYSNGTLPSIEPKFIESLCLHGWPLNVRELVQLVRRLVSVNGHEPQWRLRHLPDHFPGNSPNQGTASTAPDRRPSQPVKRDWRPTGDEGDFEALVVALSKHDGSVGRAAAAIGISRARAYRLLSAHPEFSLDNARQGK